MNLLEETIECIEIDTGKKFTDIIFIGSQTSGYSCTWDEFIILADLEYDSGYGAQEIASDLIIVFNDNSVMRRGEYDGAEAWEYTPQFSMPKKLKKIKQLTYNGSMWNDLKEINRKSNE